MLHYNTMVFTNIFAYYSCKYNLFCCIVSTYSFRGTFDLLPRPVYNIFMKQLRAKRNLHLQKGFLYVRHRKRCGKSRRRIRLHRVTHHHKSGDYQRSHEEEGPESYDGTGLCASEAEADHLLRHISRHKNIRRSRSTSERSFPPDWNRASSRPEQYAGEFIFSRSDQRDQQLLQPEILLRLPCERQFSGRTAVRCTLLVLRKFSRRNDPALFPQK